MTEIKTSKGKKVSRYIFLVLCILFALGVIMQVVFAGLAIFVNGLYWVSHSVLVHAFGFNVPILMLLTAFIGKMPRWAYWNIIAMLFLLFLMYFTANITKVLPIIAAFHPVIAMVLFVISIWSVFRAWKLVREN